MIEGIEGNEFGGDERLGTVTLPQMNHDLYIVMNERNTIE